MRPSAGFSPNSAAQVLASAPLALAYNLCVVCWKLNVLFVSYIVHHTTDMLYVAIFGLRCMVAQVSISAAYKDCCPDENREKPELLIGRFGQLTLASSNTLLLSAESVFGPSSGNAPCPAPLSYAPVPAEASP